MRIVGDLRWDQLTSKEEWMKRFPECLTDQYATTYKAYAGDPDIRTVDTLHNEFPIIPRPTKKVDGWAPEVNINKLCKNFKPGGIPINVYSVTFGSNSGTSSKTMTTQARFSFFDNSQSRAFKAALAKRYTYSTDSYCSKYTCWDLGDDIDKAGSITATPTPYTVSLLDQVKIDTSDL
jgi:hypothetical protein